MNQAVYMFCNGEFLKAGGLHSRFSRLKTHILDLSVELVIGIISICFHINRDKKHRMIKNKIK